MIGEPFDRRMLMDVARGRAAPDLVIAGGSLLNVLSGDIHAAHILIKGDRIAALQRPDVLSFPDTPVIDASGLTLTPGLIDPHMHIESSSVTPAAFARIVTPRGVSTIVIDPHEFGNVIGIDGIRTLLDAARNLPLRVLLRVPPRVPEFPEALETPGAVIDRAGTETMLAWPEAVCLAGDVNPWIVLGQDEEHLWRIDRTIRAGLTVSGYVPQLAPPETDAMIAAGVEDSHVARDVAELVANIRHGLHVLLTPRPGRFEADQFAALGDLLRRGAIGSRRISLCTDDVHIHELLGQGHLDHRLRMALAGGIPPAAALQMATLNTAELLRIDRDLGAIAPGRLADIVMVSDLDRFTVEKAVIGGRLVVDGRAYLPSDPDFAWPKRTTHTVPALDALEVGDLLMKAPPGAAAACCRVIVAGYPKTLTTRNVKGVDGVLAPDGDVLAVAVLDRHRRTGRIGRAFVTGLGPIKGAFASTINHNCHHVFAIGSNPEDMAVGLRRLAAIQGGYVAAVDGEVVAEIALPIIGMMSEAPPAELAASFAAFEETMRHRLGCTVESRLFYVLNFICSPVVLGYGVTDRGLVDGQELTLLDVVVPEDSQAEDRGTNVGVA